MLRKLDSYAEAINKTSVDNEIVGLMQKENLPSVVIKNLLRLYDLVKSGNTGEIRETEIDSIDSLPRYEELAAFSEFGMKNMDKLAVLKLNGGLGTGMGLDKAKNLLEVKPEVTFLDVIIGQIQKISVKFGKASSLILMNSFATEKDTAEFLNSKYANTPVDTFQQFKHPKIYQDTLTPAREAKEDNNWNPGGHGDVFPALVATGMLDKLISQGYEYVMISNGDNLGAVADPSILGYLMKQKIPFLMEAADRTPADKKGGHLAKRKSDGRLLLRESAQCHKEDEPDFQNINKYKYFNTNTIWIDLKALKNKIDENNGVLPLPLIRNSKTVDPTDKSSRKVYQIETAMGAAIELFEGAQAVVVPKSRFAPVKKCVDLLSLWSDIYVINDDSQMVINPKRKLDPIFVSLDDKYYQFVNDFKSRFFEVPSLINCSSFEVSGDVVFGKNLSFAGAVSVINNSKKQATLKDLDVKDADIIIDENGIYKVLPKGSKSQA